jgi:methylthioribulose-1-phosphate dehydratase
MNSPAQMKAELAAVIRTYHAKGWSPATSTNYSFRLANDPTTIYVSRSGIDKSQFSESDFIEVDLQGLPTSGFENIKPSAETLIHCALYTLYPAVNCILHSHSVYAVLHSVIQPTQVSLEGYEVLKGFEGITSHDVRVELPIFDNSQDMNAFCEELIAHKDRLTVPAFIMRKHGTYAWGENLFTAKRHLETTEYLLEVEWLLKK